METTGVWSPSLASMTTSRHHTIIVKSTPARPRKNSQEVCAGRPNRPFIQATPPRAITVAEIEPTSGQGDGLTRW